MPRKTNRSAQGSGTIRQRPDGRWEARYTVGRDSGTGKQKQKSIYGDTQQDVLKQLRQIQAAIDNGTYTEPSKMTVGQWMDIWLAEYLGGVKSATVYSYTTRTNNHIKPAVGSVPLQKLNAHTIQGFYNSLQKEKGLSPKTIKNMHGLFHGALKQAVKIGYIRFNPSEACTLPRVERKEVKPLDENDIELFVDAIKGQPYEDIYIIDLFTGMRQGEILGLTWDCVDFKQGVIYINKQLQKEKGKGGQYLLAPLKNDKPRKIAPADIVFQRLKAAAVRQKAMKLKAGQAWNNPNDLVFTNEVGKHLAHVTVYKHFKRIVRSIGMDDTRFHDLRHSYAVAALQSGDDVKSVQEALGHHTAAFTMDVYGHVTDKMRRESAERMNKFVKGIKNL